MPRASSSRSVSSAEAAARSGSSGRPCPHREALRAAIGSGAVRLHPTSVATDRGPNPCPSPIRSAPAPPWGRACPTTTAWRPSATGSISTPTPVALKILLENALRHAGGGIVEAADVERLASWRPGLGGEAEIPFMPARVVLQDFTGVPAIVDLAAMRDAMADLGGDPARVNPLVPADLVIDHSVQVDAFGTAGAFALNVAREYERNGERYQLLRWAQTAFRDLRVVPPGTGIIHQVNLEFLATVVTERADAVGPVAFPDTLVGTDSHTTMINALGVLGYGVGGIEAEAVLLGQPLYLPMPRIVGVRLSGALPRGSTATDLVLVVTEMLRSFGVVGAFVEFAGDGLAGLSLADRATIANMSPEFGATATLFPIDDETLAYLRLTGRPAGLVTLVERYAKAQGLWREPGAGPDFDAALTLDLASIAPSVAGPRRPQDRVELPAPSRQLPRGVSGDGSRGSARRCHGRRSARERRSRVRGHRGDHVLHEHLEPDRDGRGGPSRPERRRARAHGFPGRQDFTRTRFARGHRLSRCGRVDRPAGAARVRPRGLRMHHLHRQLRPARRPDRRGDRVGAPGCRRGPVGQSQLRRADPSPRAGELPGLAATRRRIRPRGQDRHRPVHGAARDRRRWQSGLPRGYLAGTGRDQGRHQHLHRSRAVRANLRDGLRRRRPLARPADPRRRSIRVGVDVDVHRPAAVLRRHDHGARRRSHRSRMPGLSPSSATASRPITSPPPVRSQPHRPRVSGSRNAGSGRWNSIPMGRGAVTTRS